MKKTSRLKDLLIVTGLVAVVAGVSHFVITNPLGPSRLLYYVQTPFIQWNTRCSPEAPDWMAGAQRYATAGMAAPASQLAYITPQGRLHHCETGWQDGIFGDQPLSVSARFRYASTTKTVTAMAVLDLVNQGKLSLTDRITEVLALDQAFKDPRVGDINIGHLLSHRAGWDRERAQDVMFLSNIRPWCPYEPEKLATTGLMYDPGTTESYSNLGYCLLGLAIEKVTGQPFREYMADRFAFAGTTLAFTDGPYRSDEVTYDMRHENFYTHNYIRTFDFEAISSSAGLSGNAVDLAKLVKTGLDELRPLTILSGEMMQGCDRSKIQSCYGYGVYRYQPQPEEMPLCIHGGKLPGATSAIVTDPQGGVLVWLGAGAARPGSGAQEHFYGHLREKLAAYYGEQGLL